MRGIPGGRSPTWPAAMTNTWFSTARARRSSSQWAGPVVVGERGGNGDHRGPEEGHDPVELGEPDVVADGQPEDAGRGPSVPARRARGTTAKRVAGRDGGRLPEAAPPQGHVEEVDLPVDGLDGPVRPEQAAGVEQAVRSGRPSAARGSCRPPDGCRSREASVGGPGERWAVQWLGPGPEDVGVPGHREVLGQDHQPGPGPGRLGPGPRRRRGWPGGQARPWSGWRRRG